MTLSFASLADASLNAVPAPTSKLAASEIALSETAYRWRTGARITTSSSRAASTKETLWSTNSNPNATMQGSPS